MVFYFVQRGESLLVIAKRYQTTVHAIVAANRLEDPNAICAGQALIIPRPGEVPSPPPGGIVHLVRPGETVFNLANKFGSTPQEILRANQVAHPEFILPGQQLVIPEQAEAADDWPMLGRTSGRGGTGPVILRGRPVDGWIYTPRKQAGVKPSAPVIRYDRIYAGLGDGHYYALDRNTGRVKWRLPAANPDQLGLLKEHTLATPVVFDGLVYLCCPDGLVLAVDAFTGQGIWKVMTGSRITSSPLVLDGLIYFGTWDEHLYAIEAKTGAIAWKRHLGAPITHPVAAGDEQLFAVSDDQKLWALDGQTGEVLWQVSNVANLPPVYAEVVLLVGRTAYDVKGGHLCWQVEPAEWAEQVEISPVAHLDQVIYPGGAVDLFSGTRRWILMPDVVSANPTTEVAGAEQVTAQVPDSGTEEEALPLRGTIVRTQVASGPLVIGVGADRYLYAWDANTGNLVWRFHTDAESFQPPAVANGLMAITTAQGSIRTYRMKPTPADD